MWCMKVFRPARQLILASGVGVVVAAGSFADANAQGRRGVVQEVPSPIQTATRQDLRDLPSARSTLELIAALEVGAQTNTAPGNLSGTFGNPVSGSFGETNGMAGIDIRGLSRVDILRGPQGTLFGPSPTQGVVNVARGPQGTIYDRPPHITGPGLAFGFRVRTYTNSNGQIQFDVHPTPSYDTFLSYRPDFSVMPYLGLPFTVWNGSNASVPRVVVTPFVGVTIERGRLKLSTDESGGGGTLNIFESTKTRTGLTLGLDTDFYFNDNWFVGLGGEVNFAPSISARGTSAGGFDYNYELGSSTNFTGKVRLGYSFDPYWGSTRTRIPY